MRCDIGEKAAKWEIAFRGAFERRGLDASLGGIPRLFALCRLGMLGNGGKGIILAGGTGSGKTSRAEVLAGALDAKVFDCSFLARFLSWKSYQAMIDTVCASSPNNGGMNIMLDDLGNEPQTVSSFGNRSDVIGDIIMARYAAWEKYGLKTIITTNLNEDALNKSYPDRISSRLFGMCEYVVLDHADWRRSGMQSLNRGALSM